jgi:hypothetical protein
MSSDTPNIIETIVCLANSRKLSGRCIAGKRTSDNSWIRPISNRETHEINEEECRYSDGSTVKLLDVIEIPCIEKRPHGHQSENVLIDGSVWKKKGRASWNDILALVDHDANLWADDFSSYYNLNNRVPERLIDAKDGSLRLIELDEMVLHVEPKAPNFGNMKLVVRASFNYRAKDYKLDVTDPEYERVYLGLGGARAYRIPSVVACISLSELHTNRNGETFAYKLVASIITKERAGK